MYGGSGTSNDPYIIDNVKGFLNIGTDPEAYFKLVSDIDFGNQVISPIVVKSTISGTVESRLAMNLDGNNHVIKNIKSRK